MKEIYRDFAVNVLAWLGSVDQFFVKDRCSEVRHVDFCHFSPSPHLGQLIRSAFFPSFFFSF